MARYLRVSERTMIRWRVARSGPSWTCAGRQVRYRLADLDAYLSTRTHTPVRGEAHVRLYRHELECDDYRSLSTDARALLVEVRALFDGALHRLNGYP